ncbi:MAG: trigger factor [Oscillospiraceae bacterium]|jgi:trigger factor|nr:trigger factor [Oscillospiraceae bacterium]
MSLKSVDKVGSNQYALEVEVDSNAFGAALEKAYRKKVKSISLPGFRKGKAPRAFVERYYGENVFFEEATNIVYPDALNKAVEESGLFVIDDEIKFDLIDVSKEKGLAFKAVITVKPEVKIENYKGLKISGYSDKAPKVAEKEINEELSRIAEQNARIVTLEKERAAKLGDLALIDFEGTVDGGPLEDGKAKDFLLKLGSGQFVAGFEEKVVGHKVSEKFEFDLKFPSDYPLAYLRGKMAIFKVHLKKIQVLDVPKIDDEFAKDVSEFDSLGEYKEFLRKNISEARRLENHQKTEDEISRQLADLVEVDIPDVLIRRRFHDNMRDFTEQLASKGLDTEVYLKYNNTTMKDVEMQIFSRSVYQIRVVLAIEKVAELEGITVTPEDIESKFRQMVEGLGYSEEKAKLITQNPDFVMGVLRTKTLDFLIKNSTKVSFKDSNSSSNSSSKTKGKESKTKKASTDQKSKESKLKKLVSKSDVSAKKSSDNAKFGEEGEKIAAGSASKKASPLKKASTAKKTPATGARTKKTASKNSVSSKEKSNAAAKKGASTSASSKGGSGATTNHQKI